MEYVLNLTTKMLSPVPPGPDDVSQFIPANAIIVSRDLADQIAKADAAGRERIVTAILGKRLLNNVKMTPEAKRILESGVGTLKLEVSPGVEPEAHTEEEDDGETISLDVETGVSSLLTKRQVSKLNHPNLLKYAREALGLDVADNEPYESIKAKVYAKQFGE